MAHDVFISHSSSDKAIADATCAHLESHGIRCWIAPRDIPTGATWSGSIVKAIAGCRVMVLILSAHSNASGQVLREAQLAVSAGVTLMPMSIEEFEPSDDLKYFITSAQRLDAFPEPPDQYLEILARTILQELSLPAPEKPVRPPLKKRKSSSLAVPALIAFLALASVGALGWYYGIDKPAEEKALRDQQAADQEKQLELQQAAKEKEEADAKAIAEAQEKAAAANKALLDAQAREAEKEKAAADAQNAAESKARQDADAQAIADAQANAQKQAQAAADALAAQKKAEADAANAAAALAKLKKEKAELLKERKQEAQEQAPSNNEPESHTYTGTLGLEACTVTLVFTDSNTKVAGTLKTYSAQIDLSGSNDTLGQVVLDASSGSTWVGTVSLTKSTDAASIVWKGSLQPVNGDSLPLSFSRPSSGGDDAAAPAPPTASNNELIYLGTMGQAACQVGIAWVGNDNLTGHLSSGGVTYTLTGDNATHGQINLTLKDPNGESLTAKLTKQLENNTMVVWSGTLQLADGTATPLSFSRHK
jgi:hypothetical protein